MAKVLFEVLPTGALQKIEIFLKDKMKQHKYETPCITNQQMSKQTQTTTAKKSGCAYCRSLGKPESVWTTHFVHKTPSENSRLTCPELLKRVCTSCSSQNHTYDKCKKLLSQKLTAGVCLISDTDAPAQVPVSVTVPQSKSLANRYADLLEDSDDEERQLTHEEIMEITSAW
uniref:Nanos-type domain-containing protein n=1 Tax=viral metagenome TaxID=1070528 RepID=A0A6C0B6C8_9ZZZZ